MKRSAIRLIIAVLSLLSSIVELLVKLVQLGTALIERAAQSLKIEPTRATVAVVETTQSIPPTVDDNGEERLVGALVGPSLGFPVRSARAFASTVRARIKTEPMDALVREGIMRLSTGGH